MFFFLFPPFSLSLEIFYTTPSLFPLFHEEFVWGHCESFFSSQLKTLYLMQSLHPSFHASISPPPTSRYPPPFSFPPPSTSCRFPSFANIFEESPLHPMLPLFFLLPWMCNLPIPPFFSLSPFGYFGSSATTTPFFSFCNCLKIITFNNMFFIYFALRLLPPPLSPSVGWSIIAPLVPSFPLSSSPWKEGREISPFWNTTLVFWLTEIVNFFQWCLCQRLPSSFLLRRIQVRRLSLSIPFTAVTILFWLRLVRSSTPFPRYCVG